MDILNMGCEPVVAAKPVDNSQMDLISLST